MSLDIDKGLDHEVISASTRFAGVPDALYERHLKFDNLVGPATSNSRERFEAAARAVRDILSDRWMLTEETTRAKTPSVSTTSRWSS